LKIWFKPRRVVEVEGINDTFWAWWKSDMEN